MCDSVRRFMPKQALEAGTLPTGVTFRKLTFARDSCADAFGQNEFSRAESVNEPVILPKTYL
jgi:hypothetical protein